jgi:hypothetical protein
MAKRNKKKLKQRKKRQLKKAIKQTIKVNQSNSYFESNKLYQMALDKNYNSTVIAKEKYINERATLLHYCNKCGAEFYGKPSHMLGKDHQKHICAMPYGDSFGIRLAVVGNSKTSPYKSKKKKSKDKGKKFYEMVINDYTPKEIAKELDIPLRFVEDYFKEEGLIE